MIAELLHYGAPFWVSRTVTTPGFITIPSDATALNMPTHASGGRRLNDFRIVITGFQYDFRAADGNGFDLVWEPDALTSPTGTANVIASPRATTAITRCEGLVSPCFLPLPSAASFSPGSAPSFLQPASLLVRPTATPPTSGRVLIWGFLADADTKFSANYGGSPFDFGALT